jgi:hypothetical protein
MTHTYLGLKNCLIEDYTNSYGTNIGGTSTSDFSANFNPYRVFEGVNYIEGATIDATLVSNSGLTYPNAYTSATLASALGDASVAAMALRMGQSPWLGHAKTLLSTVFAGYGRTFDPTVLP